MKPIPRPIPASSNADHVRADRCATDVTLTEDALVALDAAFSRPASPCPMAII